MFINFRRKSMANTSQRIWMRVVVKDDVPRLRAFLIKKRPDCTDWDLKLRQCNIIVSIPIIPINPKTLRFDPSLRYLSKCWRVVPDPGGPFQLEWMRHTGKWFPLFDAVGDLEKMADIILREAQVYDP